MKISIPYWQYLLVRLFPSLCKHWDTISAGDDESVIEMCIDCGRRLR